MSNEINNIIRRMSCEVIKGAYSFCVDSWCNHNVPAGNHTLGIIKIFETFPGTFILNFTGFFL